MSPSDAPADAASVDDGSGHEPWLSIVGIQESGAEELCERAREAISQASVVFGGSRHLALTGTLIQGTPIAWPSPLSEGISQLMALRGQRVCVLASGDPFHYGIGSTLSEYIPAAEMMVFPAPSAFSLACARLGWPLQKSRLLSLHGRAMSRLNGHLHHGVRVVALTSDGQAPALMAGMLVERNMGETRLTVLEALGGPREKIASFTAQALAREDRTFDALNVVALEIVQQGEGAVAGLAPGRSDALFEHDGQITRRDIRAMTLARLSPRPGERLWDIGAGAGSVAIEWLLLDDSLEAVAIERDETRRQRIRRNSETLGVPRLEIVSGEAPAALDGLATPQAIFVGGGVSDMALMARCFDALAPGGRLVANAVTLESELALGECHRLLGGELMRLSLEQTAPLGSMIGWTPARTITQWAWTKPLDFQGVS
ncbi:precorrin-6Y C5,15-methyltransferase (decarboxylating) [Kushneria avicenniae]|uniref:Precorrin-6Y C5,15-methyltransferase (Decarboxylating) n=1 Tax=Kushneria avicenniae TaxID=402385 RepID=A0A1I1LUK0_9GAMM|nr:precorrin-6y C5,15-methyltransferase (decarboxylating) subunit CbiE [Kushneria avicenniae]SFC74628.1 precorrin-6Y C5,15-methyltransferase (decarboxylating) [Kushneria avicenniae]